MPPAILIYLSVNLVFLPAPFVLRSIHELRALALSLAAAIIVAGIGFLLFPAELAYPSADPGSWSGLFTFAQKCSLSYNLLPSLHVAMSFLTLGAYSGHCEIAGKLILGSWAAAIAISTLVTHQHHFLDVVAGLALAAAIKWLIYDRWQHVQEGDS